MVVNKFVFLAMLFVVAVSFDLSSAKSEQETLSSKPQQRLKWFNSYHRGMKEADEKKKPVIIDFFASWCVWCEKMDSDVFTQTQIIEQLEEFVCIRTDVDQDHKVALAYGVQSLPRILVLNTNREIVGDWLGYYDAQDFSKMLDDVSQYLYKPVGATQIPKIPLGSSEIVRKVEQIQIDINDLEELKKLLGHRDPNVRRKVIEAFVQRGPDVLEVVVPALDGKYLGTRIGAWKVIEELKVTDLEFDPWASSLERAGVIKRLKEQIGRQNQKTTPQTNTPL